MHTFKATVDLIGINPFVSVPEPILNAIFESAGKSSGPIPVKGTINKKNYKQTLVKFRGQWRLYINTTMLTNSPKRIGEKVNLTIAYNTAPPVVVTAPIAFERALNADTAAKAVYEQLAPYLQKEMNRYLSNLKTEEGLHKNVLRALNFLKGKERFIGRDKPL